MEKNVLSNFKFLDYRFTNLELKKNEQYIEAMDNDESLPITVGLNIELQDKSNRAIVSLKFDIFEDVENAPYRITVEMKGFFEWGGDVSVEKAKHLCKLNATAIMFPYIRSAITDLTKIANVEPLILPAININRLIKSQEKNNC